MLELDICLFRFQISNTDHIIDVNSRPGLGPHQYDRINIICPQYPTYTQLQVNASVHNKLYCHCLQVSHFKYFSKNFSSFYTILKTLHFFQNKVFFCVILYLRLIVTIVKKSFKKYALFCYWIFGWTGLLLLPMLPKYK